MHILKALFFFDSRAGSEASCFLARTHFKDVCGHYPDYLSFHFYFLPSPGHGDSGRLKKKVYSSFIEELERINISQSHEDVCTGARMRHIISCCGLYLTLWVVCWKLIFEYNQDKEKRQILHRLTPSAKCLLVQAVFFSCHMTWVAVTSDKTDL